MRTVITIFLTILSVNCVLFSQGQFPMGKGMGEKGPMRKILELEKIKLIETLNMSEDVSVKFFTRRNQHQNELRELENRLDNLLNDMETEINRGKDQNQSKIIKLTDEFYAVTTEIHKHKNNFIMSLKDILSPEQTARLIVFERNFREEIRDILLKERLRRRTRGNN